VVIGGTHGLGNALATSLLSRNVNVIVTGRTKPENETASYIEMDVTDSESVRKGAEQLKSEGKSVDMLFYCPAYLNPEKTIRQIDKAETMKHLEIGLVGACIVAKEFKPMLNKKPFAWEETSLKPLWVHISARVGSIQDNHLGGWYSYRITKAGLNQLTKTLSVELPFANVLSVHPGTLDTRLSRPFLSKNTKYHIMPPSESAEKILASLKEVEKSGIYLDFAGKPIPW
jgi:NAD(P)-dependent dehydrogenase (short-subunit alcohol dehydrogenase family)